MKRLALLLALILCLSACAEIPPPADTAPPQTTAPVETTVPIETTLPPETSEPVAADPFAYYYALLEYTYPETNWLRNAMGCVFTTPEEIDLEFLFYAGFRDGSWDKLSPESEAYLIGQGFFREFDIQPMPADRIEEVLQQTFGISLSDCTIPDGWGYVEKEDMYCSNHNDAYDIAEYTIIAVEDDGETILIHYTVPDHFYDPSTGNMESAEFEHILTLRRTDDGSIQAASNVPAERITDFSEYAALLDFTAQPNWLARSLACVFEKPEDIDLYYLFYLGVEHLGSWNDISEESRQSLIDQDFSPEFGLQIMPCDKLEEALQATFGIGLDDVTIPEGWGYIEKENAYCSNHSDAFIPDGFTITNVIESTAGTVEIHYFCESYYNTAADDFLYTVDLILTLRRTEDGFQAVSNVLVDQSEYDSLYDRELIDMISMEEALAAWAAAEDPGSADALAELAAHSPAFAELMTRSSVLDTFDWYGPERLAALKADPETVQNAEHLALLIVSVRAS